MPTVGLLFALLGGIMALCLAIFAYLFFFNQVSCLPFIDDNDWIFFSALTTSTTTRVTLKNLKGIVR